jgi:hypothetical protein
MSDERSTYAMVIMDHIPRCKCSSYVIQLHDRIIHVLEEFILEEGAAIRGGTCGWRSAVFGRGLFENVLRMWFCYTSGLHTVFLLLMGRSQVLA